MSWVRLTDPGLLILAGVTHDDQPVAAERLAEKVWTLRILAGEKSCQDENAPILVVSQFTLYADTRGVGVHRGARRRRGTSANL